MAALTTYQVCALAFSFVVGCCVGSFLNALIWRLPRGLGIGRPRRSICPRCRNPIRWHDNIPLLSFVVLGGRCRDCGGAIGLRYPVVEGLTGLLFALVYFRQGALVGTGSGELAIMLLLTALLVAASGIDVDWLIIPDEITLFGVLGGLLAGFLLPQLHVGPAPYHTFERLTGSAHLDGLIGSAIGAVAGAAVLLAAALFGAVIFRREAMGIGDAKLMAMVGAFFGWKVAVVGFFLSPFIGLLYGIPLLFLKGQRVMPYGPFLSLGAFLALVFRTALCGFLTRYVEQMGQVAGYLAQRLF